MFWKCGLFLLVLSLSGCEKIATLTTPAKKSITSTSQLSKTAENNFWTTLHAGNYENLPETIKLLTAAYLENPNDPKLAAHLGFAHIWKITERNRVKPVPPTIVDEIILARKYFEDAVQLNPNDARFQGFLGDAILVEGKIFNDEREQVRGYFQLKHAINMWPQFNYFTAGYPMSTLDPQSKQFKEGLAWQWQTLDVCTGARINRVNPDYRPYMHLETQKGPGRACWNSWIAPHNFEGFFLNMGDMLVKSGQVDTAVKIYNTAKLSKDFSSWPYRNLLENRIKNASANVKNFQKTTGSPETTILFDSGYGCAACHQRG